VQGKTVGIFGTGKIGKIVCEILRGFKMRVIAFDVYEDKAWAAANQVEYVKTKDEIYTQSDLISLHAPLTPENFHMIDANAIGQMKAGVLIVNTGRGGLIDTKALIDGIKSGKVGGVALDVYENENTVFDVDWYSAEKAIMKDDYINQMLSYPNVLITSHQAYFTKESLEQIAKTTIENICEFLEKSEAAEPYKLKFEVK
jgi:D-lactate dehydrogenase